jgi:hypothetical protein
MLYTTVIYVKTCKFRKRFLPYFAYMDPLKTESNTSVPDACGISSSDTFGSASLSSETVLL